MNEPRHNELRADLLSTTNMMSWPGHISSPRLQMFNSQLGQSLITKGRTDRRCFTGMEPKYGEFNFAVRIPKDAHIIKTFQRYPRTLGANNIKENPETIVIYEYDRQTEMGRMIKEVDYIACPTHHTMHQNFGFRYNYINPIEEYMEEGTTIAQSPSISPEGNYQFGLETEVAMMSVPQIIEDGVVASESFCKRMETLGLETQTISWGKQRYPLNLYGDDNNYKPFPDIGEVVGEHGILIGLRAYDDNMAPVMMSKAALRRPDFKYDHCVYVEAGAKVVDVKVFHDTRLRGAIRGKSLNTPVGMSAQVEKYMTAERVFYSSILNEYKRLYGSRKDALRISPKLHRLLVECQAATASGQKQRMVKTYRGVPIDEWRVEITVEYPIVPNIGYKLTGCHGDKGVICDIRPDEDMPVDASGNRAELIMDGTSTVKRMNPSRLIEQYLNACSREFTVKVRQAVDSKAPREELNNLVLPYYHIINPQMVELVTDDKGHLTDTHITEILNDGIRLWVPTDNEPEAMDIIRSLRKHYPPTFGPVTYRGMSGNLVTTVNNVLIGSMYILLLEKTGRNWAAVASSKLSPFGIPAKLTSADRNAAPGRIQPIRFGESEARLFAAFVGGRPTSDLFDRTNNPVVRKVIQERLLREKQPTNINTMVNRREYPAGNGRVLALIRHFADCSGWRFTHMKRK